MKMPKKGAEESFKTKKQTQPLGVPCEFFVVR